MLKYGFEQVKKKGRPIVFNIQLCWDLEHF